MHTLLQLAWVLSFLIAANGMQKLCETDDECAQHFKCYKGPYLKVGKCVCKYDFEDINYYMCMYATGPKTVTTDPDVDSPNSSYVSFMTRARLLVGGAGLLILIIAGVTACVCVCRRRSRFERLREAARNETWSSPPSRSVSPGAYPINMEKTANHHKQTTRDLYSKHLPKPLTHHWQQVGNNPYRVAASGSSPPPYHDDPQYEATVIQTDRLVDFDELAKA